MVAPVSRLPASGWRLLTSVGIGVLFVGCAVLTLLAISVETGVAGLVVGVVLAALPVGPVLAALVWLDRHEAEPRHLLLFAFGWGAAVATLIALVLNSASLLALRSSGGNPDLAVFTVAPVVEETAKGLAVLGVLLLRRREFDGVVDGIVYAGMAGIGFGFVENVLYLGRSFVEDGGGQATLGTFVVRAVFSPFAHPLFTMATGIGIGLAVSRPGVANRLLAPIAGWTVAVALHAAWNASTLLGLRGFVTVYAVVQVPIFVAAIVLAVVARGREARLIADHLQVYADAGWLTPAEVGMLTSPRARRSAVTWAARAVGEDGRRAMRDFQELAGDLAFLRERMLRRTAPRDAAQTEYRLLQTMWLRRAQLLPR